MKRDSINVAAFRRDDGFYPRIDLLLTVKSFDLQAIRKRYIASRQNKSGKAGSVERRKASIGGVVTVSIENGQLVQQEVVARMKEPRGIHAAGGLTAISSEDTVYLVGDDGIRTITDPWFSYIHTVDILPDHHCLLVASSGLDCLFEFDTETLEKKYEWFAWENGFDIAHDPATGQEIVLTRSRSAAERMTQNGTAHLLVDNPRNEALPTAKRAAFINSVCYDAGRSTRFLGTYFHEGAVYAIDRMSGGATLVLDGLKNPHGGRNFRDGYMATSTGSGEVVIGSMNEQRRYDFSRISGKPDGLEDLEWLQNSIVFEDMIVTIDSNRTSFVIFNPDAGLCSVVPYDNNWAVQDLIVSELSCDQKRFIESVSDESVE